MENRSHALIAGFFTIALLALTALFAVWLGRDKIQRQAYEIVTKSAVSGLNLQAAVRYKGIKVGNVTAINFDPDIAGQIVLRIEVIPTTPVTATTFATLAYQGVTGIALVQLDDDQAASQPLLAQKADNDTPVRIPLRPSLLQTMEQRGLSILTHTEELSKRLTNLLDPANQQSVRSTIEHIDRAAQTWAALPARLEPSIARLPGLLEQTQTTLAAVKTLSADASTLSQSVSTLSSQLQGDQGPIAHFNQTLDLLNS